MQSGAPFLSLSGSGRGYSSTEEKKLPAMLEGMGQLVCSRGCTKQCFSAPILASFLVHVFRIGLALHTIGIYNLLFWLFFFRNSSSQGFKSSYHL